ncbi:uncharacterized protein LOC142574577 [Dermacentor variabilis]|uniref:uncharacterized protein LOC142574577 n=1 Tax=Dermacentor variabilis TaxID=34621 RepID=UPI003F5B31FB
MSRRASVSRRRSSVGLRRASLARRRSSVGARRRSKATDLLSSARRRSSSVDLMVENERDPLESFYAILSMVLALANLALAAALIYFLMFADMKWKIFQSEVHEVIERPGGDGSQGECLVVCFYDPTSSEWDASVVMDLERAPFSEACTHLVYSDVVIDKDAGGVLDFRRTDLAISELTLNDLID